MSKYNALMQLTYPIGDFLLSENFSEEEFNELFDAYAKLQRVIEAKKQLETVELSLSGEELTLLYNAITAYRNEQELHTRMNVAKRCGDLAYKLHAAWLNNEEDSENDI